MKSLSDAVLALNEDEFASLIDSRACGSQELLEALVVAARYGRARTVRTLARIGADPNGSVGDAGWRALHVAVENGHVELVSILVDLGADPNGEDGSGMTALHLAVDVATDSLDQLGGELDTSMIDALLAAGADPKIRNEEGATPVDWATDAGATELVERLLVVSKNSRNS